MPVSVCSCCERSYESTLMVKCGICKEAYKNTCVNLTASELRLINGNKGVDWSCPKCKESGNDIKELKQLILQLQDDIASLRNEIKTEITITEDQFEEIVAEVNDRNSRKSNLVIFGLVEPEQSQSPENRQKLDKDNIKDILNALLPDEDFDYLRPVRLGKYTPNKIRIVKITLANEPMVHKLIKNTSKLKNMEEYKHISISLDRTSRQINFYKKLKIQLSDRNNNGENCGIKYINGVPKIVNLN